MMEMIKKIKNTYKIPDNYPVFEINVDIWNKKFKNKSKIDISSIAIDKKIDIEKRNGCFHGDYFIVVSWYELIEGNVFYLVFTDNIGKFKDEYLKGLIGKIKPIKLSAGVWKPISTMTGWSFEKVDTSESVSPILNDDLFTDISGEINAFIKNEHIYKKNDCLEYKRGILMYGSPGNGKTSFIRSLTKNMNAIIILAEVKDDNMIIFLTEFLSQYIYDDILKIVILEDIDGVDEHYRSRLLNLLDGVSRLYKVMFIATTNFPEKLDIGIRNRPSRFDRFVEIEIPNEKSRELLIRQNFKDINKDELKDAVKETKGFSGAYFKELYIISILLDLSLKDSIIEMKKRFKLFGDGK